MSKANKKGKMNKITGRNIVGIIIALFTLMIGALITSAGMLVVASVFIILGFLILLIEVTDIFQIKMNKLFALIVITIIYILVLNPHILTGDPSEKTQSYCIHKGYDKAIYLPKLDSNIYCANTTTYQQIKWFTGTGLSYYPNNPNYRGSGYSLVGEPKLFLPEHTPEEERCMELNTKYDFSSSKNNLRCYDELNLYDLKNINGADKLIFIERLIKDGSTFDKLSFKVIKTPKSFTINKKSLSYKKAQQVCSQHDYDKAVYIPKLDEDVYCANATSYQNIYATYLEHLDITHYQLLGEPKPYTFDLHETDEEFSHQERCEILDAKYNTLSHLDYPKCFTQQEYTITSYSLEKIDGKDSLIFIQYFFDYVSVDVDAATKFCKKYGGVFKEPDKHSQGVSMCFVGGIRYSIEIIYNGLEKTYGLYCVWWNYCRSAERAILTELQEKFNDPVPEERE